MSKKLARKGKPAAAGSQSSTPSTDHSLHVFQRDKLKAELHIQRRYQATARQEEILNLIAAKESKLILVDGPAGTAKTYLAVLAALEALNRHTHSDLLYVRTVVESASKSIGALPGTSDEKLDPFLWPLHDKLDDLLPRNEVDMLLKEERVAGRPVNFLRGAHFNARFIVCDEAQNLTYAELITLITRMGQFSKMVLVGDKDQSDLTNGQRGGWMKLFDLFNDEESRTQGIHCLSLTAEDIVRSGLVAYIAKRLEAAKTAAVKSEPMFPAR